MGATGWQEQVLLDSFRTVNVFQSPDESPGESLVFLRPGVDGRPPGRGRGEKG